MRWSVTTDANNPTPTGIPFAPCQMRSRIDSSSPKTTNYTINRTRWQNEKKQNSESKTKACFSPMRKANMTKIIHAKWFHQIVNIFSLQKITRGLLSFFSPTFEHDGIIYRIRSPESFSIANEIFKKPTYDLLLKQIDINTVIDLGCNTGFFTCLLNSRHDGNSFKSVLVDADEEMIKESEWHLQANGIGNCQTICALIGPEGEEVSDFYVSDFNIASSAKPFDEEYPFPIRAAKKISRKVITLDNLIKNAFGNDRVNVLKVDIEGSEVDLLKQNMTCLHQVDWIIMEWHKWVIQLEDVKISLSNYGFGLVDILKEDTICGLACFKNSHSPE